MNINPLFCLWPFSSHNPHTVVTTTVSGSVRAGTYMSSHNHFRLCVCVCVCVCVCACACVHAHVFVTVCEMTQSNTWGTVHPSQKEKKNNLPFLPRWKKAAHSFYQRKHTATVHIEPYSLHLFTSNVALTELWENFSWAMTTLVFFCWCCESDWVQVL